MKVTTASAWVLLSCHNADCGGMIYRPRSGPTDSFAGVKCPRCGGPASVPEIVRIHRRVAARKGRQPIGGATYQRGANR